MGRRPGSKNKIKPVPKERLSITAEITPEIHKKVLEDWEKKGTCMAETVRIALRKYYEEQPRGEDQ